MSYRMVFDVEAVGLHGEAFAVGYVVMDENGNRVEEKQWACDPALARGTSEGFQWVDEHVGHLEYNCSSPDAVRVAFWTAWRRWVNTEEGCELWVDCGWPVEARFLMACVEQDHTKREYSGPYPLHEIGTLMVAFEIDPIVSVERLPDELPMHTPLTDARQSARVLQALLTGQVKDIKVL